MTQKQKVLTWFRTRRTITSMQAFKYLGITRLAAIIGFLKDDGYRFDDLGPKHKVNYSIYKLKR